MSLDIYPLLNPKAPGVQGGSEVDFYMLATELAKDRRFRVSVVTGDFGQADVETMGNITIFKAADIQRKPLTGMVALWKAMRLADADIYFKKGAAFTTDLVALFCRLHHKIFFLRTGTDYECNGSYLREFPLKGRTYLWSLRQAKRVFVQKTADSPKLLQTTGVNAIAVPNGHRINDLQDALRDCILWVGRTDVLKQPELFIRLAKEIPSEQFVMICQKAKGDAHYDELVRLAAGVDNLKFIEYVPFQEIDRYFQRAKVLVNTSSAEGFPNTFIQAGKCGTAILTLNTNPDGFLDRFNCGLCANGDWDKFVDSLKRLLRENRHIEMGKNARKYVEETHDISKIVEQYKKCLMNALTDRAK
ncbi:MAG: glycosyltransferase family 4 protein [Planctomycetota bacterium]